MMPSFPTINRYEKRDNNNSNNNNLRTSNTNNNSNNQTSSAIIGRKRRLEEDVNMKGTLNAKYGGDDYSKFNFRFDISQK